MKQAAQGVLSLKITALSFLDKDLKTMASPLPENLLSVSQLSQMIKRCVESSFSTIWLQGEITNAKMHGSGHFYFSLKDAGSQIGAVMFRGDAALLKLVPKDGTQVIVRGEVHVHPPASKYQIVVRELRPIGLGELLLRLEEMKVKLHQRGWFKKIHKKPLPKFPKTIGVVTSATGAAIQDILNILNRRFGGFHLILNPVRVQGEGAAQEIARAIRQFNDYALADVLIVGRGGGSMEDLWAFNEEIVAEAIFHSRIPIISAVGHECDHCIADYVADVRAPTPSAAAELVIGEKEQHLHYLAQSKRRLTHSLLQLIRQDRHRLHGMMRHPMWQSPYGLLGPWMQRLDDVKQSIDEMQRRQLITCRLHCMAKQQQLHALKPAVRLGHFRQKFQDYERAIALAMQKKLREQRHAVASLYASLKRSWQHQQKQRHLLFQKVSKQRRLDDAIGRRLHQHKERFEHLKQALEAINPRQLLLKGYCILFSENENCAITSIHAAKPKENVRLQLSDGQLLATINEALLK